MASLVHTAVADAMETRAVLVESVFTRGFAGLQMIGNASDVCRDGKERAKAALERLGIFIPSQRVVVSMAPADIKKDGNHFDLPIAMSLATLLQDQAPVHAPSRWLFAAELGLGGELKSVRGVISFALAAVAQNLEGIVVARANLADVAVLTNFAQPSLQKLRILGFDDLRGVMAWFFAGDASGLSCPDSVGSPPHTPAAGGANFDDMALSPSMRQAAVVSAAGLHSMLLRGSPGSGKSMFATRMPSIMPMMHESEHLEVLRIASAYRERLPPQLLAGQPPFRSPHHQTSAAALLGSPDQPGELSLAHGGVLFLDELPEFRRDLLEALREPLETSAVHVSRAKRKVVWRARTVLLAACNNCPCGWFGSKKRACRCDSSRLLAYWNRLSGPVLDRIDMHLNMPESAFEPAALLVHVANADGSQTISMREQVANARQFSKQRNQKFGVQFNAQLPAKSMLAASGLGEAEFSKLLKIATPKTASQRAILRSLRVARTLADLDAAASIRDADLALAWQWQAEQAARERGEHAIIMSA